MYNGRLQMRSTFGIIGPERNCDLCLQVIKKQVEEGVDRRRVGFVSKGAPARQHSEIQTPDGEKVLSPHHTILYTA